MDASALKLCKRSHAGLAFLRKFTRLSSEMNGRVCHLLRVVSEARDIFLSVVSVLPDANCYDSC